MSPISCPPYSLPCSNFYGVYIGGPLAFIPGFMAKRGLLPRLGFLAAFGPPSYYYYYLFSISSLISSAFPF